MHVNFSNKAARHCELKGWTCAEERSNPQTTGAERRIRTHE